MKYRIIKTSLFGQTGLLTYKGYREVYYIQYKGWFGWKTMYNTLCVKHNQAENLLKLAENGKLTKKGEIVI